jgi:hypothetical protein
LFIDSSTKASSAQAQIAKRAFNLEVQRNIVCLFALAGRDVYTRQAIRLALRSSATTDGALAGRKYISLSRSEEYLGVICCYEHLAPLERKRIHLLLFKVESTKYKDQSTKFKNQAPNRKTDWLQKQND